MVMFILLKRWIKCTLRNLAYEQLCSNHFFRCNGRFKRHPFIAFTLQANQAASSQLNRIRNAIYSLESFPARRKTVDWEPWATMNVRQVPVDNYVVFYIIDEENTMVSIVRVFYGGRDIEHIIQSED